MKNLSAILLAGLMVFGFACTFDAEDALAEVNQPFLREVETAVENTRAWEIGNVQRENSLEQLLFERLTSTKDLLSLVPSASLTKATLLGMRHFHSCGPSSRQRMRISLKVISFALVQEWLS